MDVTQHNRGEFPPGRLRNELLTRFLEYGDRVLRLAEQLDKQKRPRRVIDQITGSGFSPGAQMFGAHEALSAADFRKGLGIAAKELSESSYWLWLMIRRDWFDQSQLNGLLDETHQLMRIVKTMRARTKPS